MRDPQVVGLAVPMGGDGVRSYRIGRYAERSGALQVTSLDQVYDESRDNVESSKAMLAHGEMVPRHRLRALSEWLAKIGCEWDVFWTNHYGPDSQIVQDVMRDNNVPVVMDIDDWFEEVPLGNIAFKAWWGMKRRWYKECLEEADRVVASTPILADKYDGVLTPNFIDPAEWMWPKRKRRDPDECVVLCAGGVGRAGDFMEREPEFRAMLELPNVKFVFMGSFPEWAMEYPAGKVIWCRWVPYADYNRVARWVDPDVFVSPLQRNIFNEAKSNLKWLEAGMLDAVFMGERWGEYERTIADNVDGVLAKGREEWVEKLRWIGSDPDARAKIAAAGRRSVETKWSWDAVRSMWDHALLGKEVSNESGDVRSIGDPEQRERAAATG